ncbi:MAG: GNAT family N-acetyltransferase [Planctomycetales bacterium]|nr:GNAT family N-acetyltransferase [Planctomycetales bacterium]
MLNTPPDVCIRKARTTDRSAVIDMVKATEFFRPVEIEIACEVFDDAAADKPGNTYQSYVAEVGGKVAGWVAFGPTPCTLGTFDVYWIAVDPALQRHHIGSKLLAFAETQIQRQTGRLIVIETSGSERYLPTRRFYERNGYTLAAEVKEFYAPGDDKWIFTKKLAG